MPASEIAKMDPAPPIACTKLQRLCTAISDIITSGWGLLCIGLTISWLLLFVALQGEWRINPQYNYGYAVPLLSAMLFWRRWPERPAPAAHNWHWVTLCLGAILLLGFLPLRLILEANPEWRLMFWLNALQVLGLSGCILYRIGGWAWVVYFAPPLLFSLVAVPWPMSVETKTIQTLMRCVASLTVELAGWFGIPADQHGNVIEVSAGMIGIDEACSGVRSLQSGLMLSLFLGEMHRLPWVRRLSLVVASLAFVLMANLARTSFLVWAAGTRGMTQMEAWHDTAGIFVMLLVLPGLFLLAHLLNSKSERQFADRCCPAALIPAFPRWIGVLMLVWLGATGLAVEAWYRLHEIKLVPAARWNIAWPTQNLSFKKTSIPERSLTILRCSNSEAGCWKDNQGNEWSAFLLRWGPDKNSAQLAKGHRPDICFPASGAQMVNDFGETVFFVAGLQLVFRHQAFKSGEKIFQVFHCLWPDRVSGAEKTLREDGSKVSRLEAVAAGKRNLGQKVLEIIVSGPDSGTEAATAVKKTLPELLRIEGAKEAGPL